MMEALLSFLRRQVGLRTDTADPAGSLHAKVGDIAANVANVASNVASKVYAWKETNPYIIIQQVTPGSTATLLNISSGSGFLLGVEAFAYQDSSDNTIASVSITIDGTNKTDGYQQIALTYSASKTGGSSNMGIVGPLRFNSSINIRGRSSNVAGAATGASTRWVVTYCLD